MEIRIKLIYCQAGSDNNSSLSQTTITKGENSASLKVILTPGLCYPELKKQSHLLVITLKLFRILKPVLPGKRQPFSLLLEQAKHLFHSKYQEKTMSELERIVNESKTILEGNKGLYNITTSLDEGTPEVEVAIDRFKTSYYSVTVESIINQIKSYLAGSSAGSFEKDGEMKDITIKLGDISLNQLRDLMITAGTVKVPLSELAAIKTIMSPREITRRNQSRTCYIYAMVSANTAFDQVVKEAETSLKAVSLCQWITKWNLQGRN